MLDYFSYISSKSLSSVDFTSAEGASERFLKDLGPTIDKAAFYERLLASNKLKQSKLGQFHTTEEIVELVLSGLPSGFEDRLIQGARLVDPSCGTGNFLLEVVRRVEHRLKSSGKKNIDSMINQKVIPNLMGIEIDPVLAIATQKLFEFEFDGRIHTPKIVVGDALISSNKTASFVGSFDFVVGNPPWVEVKELEDEIKLFVQREFQVSNLYGAFILRGKELLKPGGHLSYVVPRSFTGGRYYSKLRAALADETSLLSISYIKNRNQEFHGGKVLQEMVILSFSNSAPDKNHVVTCIPRTCIGKEDSLKPFKIEQSGLFSPHDRIMILADSEQDFHWLQKIASFPNFAEHGFRISTGQLVLHRSVNFLRDDQVEGAKRIIYAHDIVNTDGKLTFQCEPVLTKGRRLYAVTRGTKNLDGRNKDTKKVTDESSIEDYCNSFPEIIIFRRRSHKGDKRRFVGVYVADDLPDGYFLENGLNFMVSEKQGEGAPTLKAVSRILRSDLFERFFEAVSSNTQINKNDLYLFGIPSVNADTKALYAGVEALDFNNEEAINRAVAELFEAAAARTKK